MHIGINLSFIRTSINVGVGLYTKQLIEGLLINDKENRYIIFIQRNIYDQIKYLEKNRQVKICVIKNIFPVKFRLINKLLNEYLILNYKINKFKLDVYINPYTNIFSIIDVYAKNILVIHDIHFKYYPHYYNFLVRKILKWKIGYLLKKSNKIVTISNFVKNDLIKTYNIIEDKKIQVIGNPVEIKKENYIEKKDNQKIKYILSVNSFTEWKNQITLIKAFERIKDKIPHKLILIGYGNPEKCITYIRKKNLNKRIEIKQYLTEEEIYIYYKNASLFVNTSLFEGFGRSNIEAGLMKIPVLTSSEMCLKEVSFNLLNYYRNATDDIELSKRILECLTEKFISDDYLNKIKIKFELEYNKKEIGRKFLKVINSL